MISLTSWLYTPARPSFPLMSPLYWIKARKVRQLAIMAAPVSARELVNSVADWKSQGLDIVVSLLEENEIAGLQLEEEARLCQRAGMEFIWFPIEDCGVPCSKDAAEILAMRLAVLMGENKHIGIHCRAGIGRSTLIAACVLLNLGYGPKKALRKITKARGMPVPETQRQLDWIMAFKHGEDQSKKLKI